MRRATGDVQGTRAPSIQDLDGEEIDLLGNAVENRADGASHVSSVAVTVSVVVIGGIVEPSGAALELLCPASAWVVVRLGD